MITKLKWYGFEGESGSHYIVHPTKSDKEFEKDLRKVLKKVNSTYYGEDFCDIPEVFYDKICSELIKLDYIIEVDYIRHDYIVDTIENLKPTKEEHSRHVYVQIERKITERKVL